MTSYVRPCSRSLSRNQSAQTVEEHLLVDAYSHTQSALLQQLIFSSDDCQLRQLHQATTEQFQGWLPCGRVSHNLLCGTIHILMNF